MSRLSFLQGVFTGVREFDCSGGPAGRILHAKANQTRGHGIELISTSQLVMFNFLK